MTGHGSGGAKAKPFQMLEVTVVSAQDLQEIGRSMRTYAVAWVQPGHKLKTRVDTSGHTDPTWHHKFVFRVAPEFIRSENASVTFDLYAARRAPLPDVQLGTARLILSTISGQLSSSARFTAVQIRRPTSLRPQGILNLSLAILEPGVGYARSAPLLDADLPLTGTAAAVVALPGDHHVDVGCSGAIEIASMRSKLDAWRAELMVSSREFERKKVERLNRDRQHQHHHQHHYHHHPQELHESKNKWKESVRTRGKGDRRECEAQKTRPGKEVYWEEQEEEEHKRGRKHKAAVLEEEKNGGGWRRGKSFGAGSRFACFGIGAAGGGRWVEESGAFY